MFTFALLVFESVAKQFSEFKKNLGQSYKIITIYLN